MPAPWPEGSEESEAKRPRVSDTPLRSKDCRRSIQSAGGLCWSSADITLAATLLETPSARFPSVKFTDLEEKRRVFTLVYDVLRYKSVLNQALSNLYFFNRFPHLKERCHLVWLLFFDLYKRDFSTRDALEPEVEEAFSRQGLHEIDEVLWQMRVKLAATVSRLRIKSGAHSLSQLLPRHLQIVRSALEENVITGWVNGFKTSVKEACQCLENLGINSLSKGREILDPLSYKTDHLLPRFLHVMPNLRDDLVNSPLISDHHIIMQERTFCLGPAVMAQMLKHFALGGKVAQTHVNSPITMAYFANLLINNDKIEAFLVFGAGYKKEACEQYLRDLGVKNTQVYSESFADLPPESRVLDNVIAVLATPPNTNSSVVDPVDLAVARGGDLQILQELTDTDFSSTPRGTDVTGLLVEQRDTLRRAMSKPQIQFIIYETHSRFDCENEEMASNVVNEMNNYAAEVHLEELRRQQGETQERERAQAAAETSETPVNPEVPAIKLDEDVTLPIPTPTPSVSIPPSDLFEVAELPDLCPNFENCLDLGTEGTYIAVIKRKEVTRLDPKYMISMAEARGLFGRPEGTPKTKQSGQTARAKAALAALQARQDAMAEKSKTKVKVEVDRIAAPTRASLLRDIKPPETKDCPRHTHHQAHDGTPSYMRRVVEERKVYLTKQEEEDLIRRLYTSPKINTYPARLHEDLPTLKFWNSPASVIEGYLQRKIFQQRLQLAYEFNQSKVEDDVFSSHVGEEEKAKQQLTQAMIQLTADMNYFQYLASEQVVAQVQEREVELDEADDEYQNKALWDQIVPPKTQNIASDSVITGEIDEKEESCEKWLFNIKQRFTDYKNFYKLRNLSKDERPPLAKTIGLPKYLEFREEDGLLLITGNTESKDDIGDPKIKKKSFSKKVIVQSGKTSNTAKMNIHDSFISFKRLPKREYSSLVSLEGTGDFKRHSYSSYDEATPKFSSLSLNKERYSTKNTSLSVRDSIVLAHKRMSSYSKTSLLRRHRQDFGKASLAVSHRDSYTIIFQKKLEQNIGMSKTDLTSISQSSFVNQLAKLKHKPPVVRHSSNVLSEHRDSFFLTSDRLTLSREKPSATLECDICNGEWNRSIHFTCSYHANLLKSRLENVGPESDENIKQKNKLSNHRDSLEIIPTKMTFKGNSHSTTTTQTNFDQ